MFNQNKGLKASIAAISLALSVSGCTSLSQVASVLGDDALPPMPAADVVTYVVDLSGSTFPAAQLQALQSGISDFVAGDALGDPFAATPAAPRSLSIQFISANSAQAPRILLASAKTGMDLYEFVKEHAPNLEGARQLWSGIVRARSTIAGGASVGDNETCVKEALSAIGRQQLLDDLLATPATRLCDDAAATQTAMEQLESFFSNPAITMGSDVEGALIAALNNLGTAADDFPNFNATLVMASDLVDNVSLRLPRTLTAADPADVCEMARNRASDIQVNFTDATVVLVGTRNSKESPQLVEKVLAYWRCYLEEIQVRSIQERSDLTGF